MTEPLNILVAGIYWSGSGAVVDYLKGHPDCAVPRGEFTDFKRRGRIGSLLEARSSARARWLARAMWLETALGKLPLASWKQRQATNPHRLPIKEQVQHHRLKLQTLAHYRAHLRRGGDAAASDIWNLWLRAVAQQQASDKAAVVWNQPIWIGKHEGCWPTVFAPCKLVVVHRDPCDQFAEVVRQGKIGKRKSDPAFDDSIKDDIAYVLEGIAGKMESLIALRAQLPEGTLLNMHFEDFVLDHHQQAARLSAFLGLPLQQTADAPFDPAQSAKNIGIGKAPEIQAMLAPYQHQLSRLYELREQL